MGLLNYLKLYRRRRKLERKGPAKRRKQEASNEPATKTRRTRGISLVAAIAVLMVWGASSFSLLYQPAWDRELEIVPGMPIPADKYARIDFTYTDLQATDEARNVAAAQIEDIFSYNAANNETTRANFSDLLAFLDQWSGAPRSSEDDTGSNRLEERFGNHNTNSLNQLKLLFDGRDRRKLLMAELDQLIEQGIISETARQVRTDRIYFTYDEKHSRTVIFDKLLTPTTTARRLMESFCEHFQIAVTPELLLAADRVLAPQIKPNLKYSHELTMEARELARTDVEPIRRNIKKDMLILEQGDDKKVTQQDIIILKAHREKVLETRSGIDYLKHIGQLCGWSLMLSIVGAVFFAVVLRKTCSKKGNVLLIALVMSGGILLVWGTTQLVLNVRGESPLYLYPALPILFSAALLSLLLGPREGMAAGVWVSLLVSLQGGDATHIMVLGIASSIAAALSIHSARTRIQTFRAAAYPPVIIVLVEFAFLFRQTSPLENWPDYLIITGIAFVGCFLTLILVNIFLPILEYFFDLTTNISLLELSDLNHPLLRRLSLEAPGTYTHTMMVATLAEHAAEAIGANTLLTRVAAYFHDIGKLANPDYFTENSFGENMHEDLSPKMSSLIILNHVKEGLALAQKHKLKPPLREAIATHHGTSLVYFFYHRAKTEKTLAAGGGEHEFRYPGPRPQSAAATIICLSDPCEAASRSLEKPTPQKISSMVNEIFISKLRDGQLDNSELTMAELHTVRETIKKTLRVMLHSRIAYPKDDNGEVADTSAEKTREVPQDQILDHDGNGQAEEKSVAATNVMNPETDESARVETKAMKPDSEERATEAAETANTDSAEKEEPDSQSDSDPNVDEGTDDKSDGKPEQPSADSKDTD